MFKSLKETIKALNADVKNVANCEKAKKLRKKLLVIGLSLAIIGLVGLLGSFALFASVGMSARNTDVNAYQILLPFFLVFHLVML